MVMKEREGTKYPWSGGMGENTPFTKQSKEKGAGQGSGHTVSLQFQFKVHFLSIQLYQVHLKNMK